MDEAKFWRLVEAAQGEMTPELSNQADILQAKLEGLPPDEIVEFARIQRRLLNEAYRWDLWAAAYIIEGGCSDDGFEYFRAGLIGFGREVFYAAVRDPNTLVRQPTRGVDFSNEDLLYVADKAFEATTGRSCQILACTALREPVGEKWDEESVEERYPELAKKFGSG